MYQKGQGTGPTKQRHRKRETLSHTIMPMVLYWYNPYVATIMHWPPAASGGPVEAGGPDARPPRHRVLLSARAARTTRSLRLLKLLRQESPSV